MMLPLRDTFEALGYEVIGEWAYESGAEANELLEVDFFGDDEDILLVSAYNIDELREFVFFVGVSGSINYELVWDNELEDYVDEVEIELETPVVWDEITYIPLEFFVNVLDVIPEGIEGIVAETEEGEEDEEGEEGEEATEVGMREVELNVRIPHRNPDQIERQGGWATPNYMHNGTDQVSEDSPYSLEDFKAAKYLVLEFTEPLAEYLGIGWGTPGFYWNMQEEKIAYGTDGEVWIELAGLRNGAEIQNAENGFWLFFQYWTNGLDKLPLKRAYLVIEQVSGILNRLAAY